jgi:capsular polysaccharide transport system permease protein
LLRQVRHGSSTTAPSSRSTSRDGLRRLSGWQIQWRVVDALTYRELRTRVSEATGGILGVLIQPLGTIAIWTAFMTVLNTHRGGSLNVVLFLTSGIILFTIFSQIASRSLTSMEANEALLFYRPVKPIDTIIARMLCETGLYMSCLFLICIGTWIVIDQVVMSNFALFALSILMIALLGFSVGLLFMVAVHHFPAFRQVAPWLLRVLWFLSGVPFRYWYFPSWTRGFFVWNPLMHCIELNRSSMSDGYFTPDASVRYAATCVVLLLTLSLWVYQNNERRLQTL